MGFVQTSMTDYSQNIVYRKYNFDEKFPLLRMEEHVPALTIVGYHFHNCIELAYSAHGAKRFVVENQTLELQEGEACFIPPFHMHASCRSEHWDGDISFQYLFFNIEDLLAPLFPQGVPQELLWFKCDNAPYLLSRTNAPTELFLVREIIALLTDESSKEARLSACGMLQSLLIRLSRRNSGSPRKTSTGYIRESLLPALTWLRDHYQEKPNNAALAELCRLPLSQFNRDFKAALCKSPEHYVKMLRIQRACEQMIQTDDSILDIALSVGFESSSSFYYNFCALIGDSPNAWRKRRQSFHKKEYTVRPYSG